ncbi:MAG: hypothetical protein JNM84_08000 [Planctomycetes bacterium]|nr:hypothetical protein [Planctomycetota bacterium]
MSGRASQAARGIAAWFALASLVGAQSIDNVPILQVLRVRDEEHALNAEGLWRRGDERWELALRAPFRAFCASSTASGEIYLGGGTPAERGLLARFDAAGRLLAQVELAEDLIYAVAIDQEARHLVVACADGRVLLLDPASLAVRRALARHGAAARRLAFAPQRALLASAGLDGQVLLLDLASEAPPLAIGDHLSGVEALAFSPDGARLASGARDGRIRIHALDGRSLRISPLAGSAITALAWTDTTTLRCGTLRGALLELHEREEPFRILRATAPSPTRTLVAQ